MFNNGYDRKIHELSGAELKNRLQAGLGCAEVEYNAIEDYLQGAGKNIEPTPSRLALPYRIKNLADLFEMPVHSLFTLFALFDKNYSMIDRAKFPLPISFEQSIKNSSDIITIEEISAQDSIKNILWLVQLTAVFMQWLNDNEMTVEQLEFICTEHSNSTVEDVPSREETQDLFRELDGQFRPVLFKQASLLTGITDKLTADILYEKLSDLDTGVITEDGVIRATTTVENILPVYLGVIREKLFIEPEDLTNTVLSLDEPEDVEKLEVLTELFLAMQNKGYIDLDGYISNDDSNILLFSDPRTVEGFLPETDRASAAYIFKEISERVKNYSRTHDAAESECAAIAQKISVQAQRQQSILFRTLADALNVAPDVIEILCITLFRTSDETEQMATVRFMSPVMEAIDREVDTGVLVFDASLITSFRRLLQFSLLVLKTELKARELEVLFYIKGIQDALPEKLKLPASFRQKIDVMYSNTENDIVIFSGDQYIRFSGEDYSFEATGDISELTDVPAEFHSGVNAAIRDWAPEEAVRKTYFFSGNTFSSADSPDNVVSTDKYWGKVRNHIAELNRVDAAHRAEDGKLYLFSDDQYVRYSSDMREYIDEGYPKNILRNWNNENQVQLPIEIRKKVDSIFIDSDEKAYFFSNDKFIDSSDPSNVKKTKDHWARVLNNIIDNNKVDAVLVRDGISYMFSGDQYTRYSSGDYSYTDEGYPRKIENNWDNEGIIDVAGDYRTQINAAFNGMDNQVYLFNGNTYISTDNTTSPSPVNEKWGKVLNNLQLNNRVDSALVKDGKTYLFSGDQYVKYSGPDYITVDEGYPKKITRWNTMENNGTLPDTFNSGITAAFTAQDNTAYYFSETQYISSQSDAQPGQIKDVWAVVRNNIQANNKLDAGFMAPDGTSYIFSGDQFFRYSAGNYTAVDEGYPKKIQGNWGALPASFNTKIDAAFIFKVDGVDRLYMFSGSYYVRYSEADYSRIDAGYPKKLDNSRNSEGSWFEPIFNTGPHHHGHDHRHKIATIFTDQYNNKPRINFFYYDDEGREKLIKYEYLSDHDHDDDSGHKHYKWSKSILVSKLSISPFTSVDVGFSGVDGKVYLFSGNNFSAMIGNYEGIAAPESINGTWGLIHNRFQDLNRVDSVFRAVNGYTYLFCDTQYVRYSGDITPENPDFFSDEGYPKTIAGNWNNENSSIQLPTIFTPQENAVFSAPDGVLYAFSGDTFVTSTNHQPVSISDVWGKVGNNFESLNRVDAALVQNNTSYLFSGNQYTRYSGDYSGYADEGYPKKIVHMAAEDGIDVFEQFPDGIDAIMVGADSSIYVFADSKYMSSSDPSITADINSRFGIVRNNIADTGIIDAADTTGSGIRYLFSGDQYVRYSTDNRTFVDEAYPKTIANWNNFEQGDLPDTLNQGIKASFTDFDGEEYFFTETDFFSLSNPTAIAPINSKWGKLRNNIHESGIVDAAFIAPNGKTYLFSGDQYVQYTPDVSTYVQVGYPNADEWAAYVDEGFPRTIADNWGDLPDDYRTGIDAAFVFDARTYFFKDASYIRYSDPANKIIDTGFPREIADKMNQGPEFWLNDVKIFQQFKLLSKNFNQPDRSILPYFTDSKNGLDLDTQLSRLSSVTEWQQQEISFLLQSNALSATDIGDIQVLSEMSALFDVSENMVSLPSTLKPEVWDKIYGTTIALEDASIILAGQLKTKMGAAAWSDLSSDLKNTMNLAKRDALLGYLIYKMEQDVGTEWIQNPRDLYEYLLIDVEMGEEAIASRVQEAIMCMQLFYHRTLMNLENEDQETMKNVKEKLKSWWIWMKNYRVWEANRKVFLYPENYIRPELRLDKSPEFKELEEALLQGDITDDTADVAYKKYLDKYSEVSRLRVTGGYVYQRTVGDPDDESQTAGQLNEKRIIMFGHSNTEPKKYYYMTGDILEETDTETGQLIQSIDWAPWKDIGINIDADKVYPVFAFNRLFVFWVEVRERDQSTYKSAVGPDEKKTQYDPVIFYSFYNLKEEWTHPQKMFDIGVHVDKPGTLGKDLFFDDKYLKKTSPNDYINAPEVLTGARLYVTNPITSRYYNADEYIYISYEVRYTTASNKNYEFLFEGKLKSDLEFEDGVVGSSILDKLEKNIEFPIDKFKIRPVSFYHWKGFHNDSFSAPWFSFIAGGGSFLAKPYFVPNSPEIIKSERLVDDDPDNDVKIDLFDISWQNLPDAGFTDSQNRKHLFYREDLDPNSTTPQLYRVIGEDTSPEPVAGAWGKGNIFIWYPDDVTSVVVNGDKLFMATNGDRYLSYTGPTLEFIDQATANDTLTPFSIEQILPAGVTVETWHRIKENLGDYLTTLENAFVFSGDNQLYLVANPVNDAGDAVPEYTIPDQAEFFAELAAHVSETTIADMLRSWITVQSANFYTENANKRLYITSGDNVFIKDYITGTDSIHTIAALTHPDLTDPYYNPTPSGTIEIPWTEVNPNLMELIIKLTRVGRVNDVIRFIGRNTDGSYVYTVPEIESLFDTIANIVNDVELSPVIAGLTELSAADIYNNGSIRRLYLRSVDKVVIFDYKTGAWSLSNVSELIHPDVTEKVSSLSGLLPAGPAVSWDDVAEDFNEYIATVGAAIVWKGDFYLLTPSNGGGVEYSSPSASVFWKAVADNLSAVSGYTTIDSAAVLEDGAKKALIITSGTNVVVYDYSTSKWKLTTINAEWGIGFTRIDALVQSVDGNIYLFSGSNYAVKQGTAYVESAIETAWGYVANAITSTTKVDSAFIGEDGKVYLFSGDEYFRYSDVDNRVIDEGYPKKILADPDVDPEEDDGSLGISEDEIKEEFSTNIENVEIVDIGTNTAFVQKLPVRDGTNIGEEEEKLYLFVDVSATITTYIWRVRWRWWGGWNWRWRRRWFTTRFVKVRVRHRFWWGWWWPEYYRVERKRTERKSVYVRFSHVEGEYLMDEGYPRVITGNWSNLPGDFNKMISTTFEDVEGTGENEKQVFYAIRTLRESVDGIEKDTNDYVKYEGKENFPKEIVEEDYEIIRLTSNTSEELSQRLFLDGIGGVLTLETQGFDELPHFELVKGGDDSPEIIVDDGELIFQSENEYANPDNVISKNDIVEYSAAYIKRVPASKTLDFTSINAQYYWEIFFHGPFLIAQAFNNAQKFDQSTKWYEYIFDPTEDNGDNNKAYWKYLPFHVDIEDSQSADLNNPIQFRRYLNDPFDPHAIAGLRQIAYRKAIVMSYIDNLIDHGDLLFRQYTRETINEARMLYVLAYDLLGKKPELLGTRRLSDARSYKQLREEKYGINMVLVELENLPSNAVTPITSGDETPNGSLLDPYGYFYIPENREFSGYWDRVEDRLFKIRQSLNIVGIKQRLPLFEPPLDVMALVRAVGSGLGLAQALADFNVAIPHYRFAFIMGKARELNARLTQFGQSLLSALEKKDAEELALLRNTHEKAILKLTLDIKEAQLEDSKETLSSLRANLSGAQIRDAYYSSLINQGLSPYEQSQLSLLATAQVFTNLSQAFSISASVGGMAPEAGAFAFHWGGHNLNALFTGLSQSFSAISSNFSYSANLASTLGGYHRRGQDWNLQQNLAQTDIESIERQIAGAEIKIKIAQLDIQSAKTSIKNLESVDTFMKSKFTNLQLYRWMSGKLSGLYFQTYQMTLDMAKAAQKSFQFELGVRESEVNYIGSLYWDSLKKGLLAGESLQVDLDRLETAYIEKNKRTFEISKTVSLQQLDPLALLNLRENRVCEFTLAEELFDYDFPGHYCRQIKAVSITFPAVAGPYENVNATLTQLSHRTLIDPDKAGVEYMLKPEKGVDQPLSIRADWRTNQQIALSRGVNDAGLFQLNFQDERYLPFEGTGAISTWRLELNGQESAFDVRTLSDVVIKIEYSALQGGDVFAAAVKKLLKPSPAAKVFNLAEDFSAEWNSFMEHPSGGLKVKVTRDMFPNLGSRNKVTGLYMLFSLSKDGVNAIGETAMKLNTIDVKQATMIDLKNVDGDNKELSISSRGSNWTLMPASAVDEFTPENISNIALVCVYEKKAEF
ncbi:MAG: hemopexin repeat-containing protein [Gammaproteobacteria bacterium]